MRMDYKLDPPDDMDDEDTDPMESDEEPPLENFDSYEDDDNRFAGLNSHGNDIFGRSGW